MQDPRCSVATPPPGVARELSGEKTLRVVDHAGDPLLVKRTLAGDELHLTSGVTSGRAIGAEPAGAHVLDLVAGTSALATLERDRAASVWGVL